MQKQYLSRNFNHTFLFHLCEPKLNRITTKEHDLTWNKHVENIVAKAGKRVYMLYQLKRAGIGQHDICQCNKTCSRICMSRMAY